MDRKLGLDSAKDDPAEAQHHGQQMRSPIGANIQKTIIGSGMREKNERTGIEAAIAQQHRFRFNALGIAHCADRQASFAQGPEHGHNIGE